MKFIRDIIGEQRGRQRPATATPIEGPPLQLDPSTRVTEAPIPNATPAQEWSSGDRLDAVTALLSQQRAMSAQEAEHEMEHETRQHAPGVQAASQGAGLGRDDDTEIDRLFARTEAETSARATRSIAEAEPVLEDAADDTDPEWEAEPGSARRLEPHPPAFGATQMQVELDPTADELHVLAAEDARSDRRFAALEDAVQTSPARDLPNSDDPRNYRLFTRRRRALEEGYAEAVEPVEVGAARMPRSAPTDLGDRPADMRPPASPRFDSQRSGARERVEAPVSPATPGPAQREDRTGERAEPASTFRSWGVPEAGVEDDLPPPLSDAAPLHPVDVPAPAMGRGGARAGGRVKTRLLGFNPGAAPDPFARDRQHGTASGGASAALPAYSEFPVGWLAVIRGPGRGATFTLFAGVSTIGRGTGQTVQLDFGDSAISREQHAAIAFDPEDQAFYVGHGGKANLVRLNNRPVLSTEVLKAGDTLRIGETELRFVPLCDQSFAWDDAAEGDHRHADAR